MLRTGKACNEIEFIITEHKILGFNIQVDSIKEQIIVWLWYLSKRVDKYLITEADFISFQPKF